MLCCNYGHNAECRYTERHYAQCHYTEYRYAECHCAGYLCANKNETPGIMTLSITIKIWYSITNNTQHHNKNFTKHKIMTIMLSVIMLSVFMLSVIMLSAIMLSVVMLNVAAPCIRFIYCNGFIFSRVPLESQWATNIHKNARNEREREKEGEEKCNECK